MRFVYLYVITIEKLEIYKDYHGDGDMCVRIGKAKDKTIMDENDWGVIDDLVQDIILIDNSSMLFKGKITSKIKLSCDSLKTENYLIALAKQFK